MFAWLKTSVADRYCSQMYFNIDASGNVKEPGFAWEQEQKEFIYKGSSYDVVSVSVNNHQLVIKCVPDKAEDQLTQKMQLTMGKGATGKSPFYRLLLNYFPAVITVRIQKQRLLTDPGIACQPAVYSCYFPSVFYAITTPPPKMG